MSIIPASRLSASDLARLGNNFSEAKPTPRQRRRRSLVAAVNRSLINFGEQVDVLHRLSPVAISAHPGGVAVSA